jgi:hypothetical protein
LNWATLAFALTVAAGCSERPPLADWPPDAEMAAIESHVAESRGQDEADRWMQWHLTTEHAFLLSSEMVVVGTVASLADTNLPEPSQGFGPNTCAFTVDIEECVKGDCGRARVTAYMARGIAGEGPPRTGGRYVFFLREHPTLQGVYLGGFRDDRFEIRSGVVTRKGMELEDFVSIIRRHLASRTAVALYGSADAALLATVGECERSVRYEGDPHFRSEYNFARLHVDEVGKGPFAAGDTVEVRLSFHSIPQYGIYEAIDGPNFITGEHAVVFLCERESGEWSPAAGADSRIPARPDGSFGTWRSLSALAEAAGD